MAGIFFIGPDGKLEAYSQASYVYCYVVLKGYTYGIILAYKIGYLSATVTRLQGIVSTIKWTLN